MLEVKNLSFRYNKKSNLTLDNINMTLSTGKIGILLGKNGSGKSTLIKNILGILKPESGEVLEDNINLLTLKRNKRAELVSYVPQDITFGDLSVFDSVLTGRMNNFGLNSRYEDEKKVEDILKDLHLEHLALKNVNELSGGERQKVAIARALVQDPKLLVFDEPTGNLDIGNEQIILKECQRLAENKGITILIAIHDINLALEFGNEFFLLKDGKLMFSGNETVMNSENINTIFDVNCHLQMVDGHKIILLGENKDEK